MRKKLFYGSFFIVIIVGLFCSPCASQESFLHNGKTYSYSNTTEQKNIYKEILESMDTAIAEQKKDVNSYFNPFKKLAKERLANLEENKIKFLETEIPCDACEGTGSGPWKIRLKFWSSPDCKKCNGTGKINLYKFLFE